MVDLLKDAKYIKGVGPNRIKQLRTGDFRFYVKCWGRTHKMRS